MFLFLIFLFMDIVEVQQPPSPIEIMETPAPVVPVTFPGLGTGATLTGPEKTD